MATLYHPNLPKGQNVIEVPDDEGTISVHEKSGWTRDVPKARKEDEPANTASRTDEGGK